MSSSVLTVKITGVAPLVMHNGRMADPLYPIARELERYTAKRKTDADHHRIADLEFSGGLWLDDGRPCIPAEALEASICQSAARRRAKALYRGAVMVKANAHLAYDGPRSIESLKADPAFRLRVPVAINGRRLIRTRPMFPEWSSWRSILSDIREFILITLQRNCWILFSRVFYYKLILRISF